MVNQIMFKKIKSKKLAVDNCFKLEIDRILIFVDKITEIEMFRKLNFHHFEFITHNIEQGTISNIFFVGNISLELIRIENHELAARYSAQTNIDLVSRTQWQQNQAFPFGLVLRYVASQKSKSRRRYYRTDKQKINSSQPSSQINFSIENLQTLEEPACYIVPQSLTSENLLDSTSAIKQKLLFHQSKINKLTNIKITLNTSKPLTNTVSLISTLELINIKRGNFSKLELEFDNCNKERDITVFSSIPMVFYY